MQRFIPISICSALVACGGPSSDGQDAKTPDEILAEQEALGAEQERKRQERLETMDEAGETDMEKKRKFDQKQAELELKRAARSAASCPGVVDEEGPGGSATVNLTFAFDGHVKASTISSEFSDTKLGKCILNAMEKVIVPTYVGDQEVSVDWTIELEKTEPKKEEPQKGNPKKK